MEDISSTRYPPSKTADRISVENGAVICNCKRWPLIIDPQGQGIKWLRQKEAAHGLQVWVW